MQMQVTFPKAKEIPGERSRSNDMHTLAGMKEILKTEATNFVMAKSKNTLIHDCRGGFQTDANGMMQRFCYWLICKWSSTNFATLAGSEGG